MKIVNFMLQHELSPEQISAGLYNPVLTDEEKDKLKKLMIVDPNADKIYPQALELFDKFILKILKRENAKDFHIMGQANLMLCLYKVRTYFIPIGGRYEMWESTTERVSQEIVNADGTTTKTNVFKFVKLRRYGE